MFHKEFEFYVSENHRADEATKLPLSLRLPVCIPLTTKMKIRSKSYNDKGPEQTHLNFNLIDNAIRTNHFKASCCFFTLNRVCIIRKLSVRRILVHVTLGM